MDDLLEARLPRQIWDAGLPPEEPVMRWIECEGEGMTLKLRAHDHALLVGRCEYRCLPRGWVAVSDYRDPRSMRSQVYQPDRPGQPYMAPSREDCNLPTG